MDKQRERVIYATDLDRTLIYSERALKEFGNVAEVVPIETVTREDGTEEIISYISVEVLNKLIEIYNNEDIIFVPVTSRSIEEYNRIKLPFIPKYAITSNGARMFKDGVELTEWTDYIKKNMPEKAREDLMDITMDLTMSKAISKPPRLVDDSFIFFKVNEAAQWDAEELHYHGKYDSWDFVRQKKKVYATPKHFSKQVSLRWLWYKLDKPYIVASGDSELDVPMLTLANKAIIPSHSYLLSDELVLEARVADGGVRSPLETIKIVEGVAESKNWLNNILD